MRTATDIGGSTFAEIAQDESAGPHKLGFKNVRPPRSVRLLKTWGKGY